jgi:hypothetical protein
MAFVVSSLTDYVDQSSQDLIAALQFESETAKFATVQPGIKSAAALQLLAVSPIPQAGETCGFTASGSVTFSQRTLTTIAVKYNDSLCPRALQAKWTQLLLGAGQKYTESDIPKKVVDELKNNILRIAETADWMGDTNSGSAYLKLYDGLVKIIGAASPVTATSSTFNATNARAIVKNILANIPAALKGNPDVKMVMGYDAAEIYRQALMDANLYAYPAGTDGTVKTIMAEGSNVEIVPVHGLDARYSVSGAACIFAFRWSNIFLGVDMLNEEEEAKMWYSNDDDLVYYAFRFRRGWQIAYGSEIVQYSNS